jgi:hypothetical protein
VVLEQVCELALATAESYPSRHIHTLVRHIHALRGKKVNA